MGLMPIHERHWGVALATSELYTFMQGLGSKHGLTPVELTAVLATVTASTANYTVGVERAENDEEPRGRLKHPEQSHEG
ncbi:hypothetical protein H1O16_gp395 [Burkholderia phage BcepSaruman]|uniref:Uncharacterized protein n=1 Tax=Burkholderia phage BcepSaruman TaxID=2530032 RepID=A0A4D5ZIB7_9CAUD|nr:hypothetical protein H1O16_gp395 [Burkholderia phage BcepSaruman]QBX06808.1 hypothetical protein BcepSaruman_395 [Burkholderia phage BcepSaruman]